MTNTGPVMLDIAGFELTEADRVIISSEICGGLILFSRNFQNAHQVLKLTQSIRAINPNILIAVDQEGGRVQRFTTGFSKLPALSVLGRLYQQDPVSALEYSTVLGEIMALEVQSVGCDISFAPVLDLGFTASKVIGDRAFSSDPDILVLLAQAYIEGMSKGGMAATGKHFPGHGSVEADSHTHIPYDDRSYAEIKQQDLKPFAQLSRHLAAIMPAHIIYPQVDPAPAGFSSFWIEQVLRTELEFDGVVFSDDLSMKGAEAVGGFTQRALCALNAGCDMILVCNDRAATHEVITALENYKGNKQSHNRLSKLKMKSAAIGLDVLQQTDHWLQLSQQAEQYQQKVDV